MIRPFDEEAARKLLRHVRYWAWSRAGRVIDPNRHAVNEVIEAAESRLLFVANWVETSIVIEVR